MRRLCNNIRSLVPAFCIIAFILILVAAPSSNAQAQGLPKISVGLEPNGSAKDLSVTLQIVLMLTVLTLAPSIVVTLATLGPMARGVASSRTTSRLPCCRPGGGGWRWSGMTWLAESGKRAARRKSPALKSWS